MGGRLRFQHRSLAVRISDTVCPTWIIYRTGHQSSDNPPVEMTHHLVEGRRILTRSGAGLDAPIGAHGDRGGFPTDKDSRALRGFLPLSSAHATASVSPFVNKSHLPPRGARRYTPHPKS